MIKKVTLILFAAVLMGCNIQAGPIDVQFTWTAPGDNGNEGTCSSYKIVYSQNPITDANWDTASEIVQSTTMTPNPAGTPETLQVTMELQSETPYYFRMKACDEVPNCSELSNEVMLITPDIDGPDTPVITVDFILVN